MALVSFGSSTGVAGLVMLPKDTEGASEVVTEATSAETSNIFAFSGWGTFAAPCSPAFRPDTASEAGGVCGVSRLRVTIENVGMLAVAMLDLDIVDFWTDLEGSPFLELPGLLWSGGKSSERRVLEAELGRDGAGALFCFAVSINACMAVVEVIYAY